MAASEAPAAPAAITAVLEVDHRRALGEGALWDAATGTLYSVDVVGGKLFAYQPETGAMRKVDYRQPIGTVVVRQSGGLVLALMKGIVAVDIGSDPAPVAAGTVLEVLANPEANVVTNRFNDGKCDPAGRFWVGSVDLHCQGAVGKVYCLYPDGHVETKIEDTKISNGIVWNSAADTMYYIDTPLRRVDAFDYDNETGAISNRRVAVDLADAQGFPDGMAIDSEDKLWVAMWGGASVLRLDPESGAVMTSLPLPAAQVTSCAFGGANLDQLFVTTARCGLPQEDRGAQPYAGSLFRFDLGAAMGVRGVPSAAFLG